jgi:glyoxylate/hydroxypyruvate reductase A
LKRPIHILFSAAPEDWPVYERELHRALAERGLHVTLAQTAPDPFLVDYIVYSPHGPVQDFKAFPRLKAVLSLWAGVERIISNPTLGVPLCRMVDASLTEGMVEWVTGHVLRYHLGMDDHILGQDGRWRHEIVPPLARERSVGILGLGILGASVAKALSGLNFDVAGWSRHAKSIPGIRCHQGPDGLRDVLSRSEIVVLLLPRTDATENIMNRETIGLMPRGSRILNPGRGELIDDDALLEALGTGQIAHATLDVFRTEPLPPEHPYWAHPKVTVTPHIASETRAKTASDHVALNIARIERGEAPIHVADPIKRY